MKYFTFTAVFLCLCTVGALLTLTLNESPRDLTIAETSVSESDMIRLGYEEIGSDYAAQEPAPLAARIIIVVLCTLLSLALLLHVCGHLGLPIALTTSNLAPTSSLAPTVSPSVGHCVGVFLVTAVIILR